MENLYEILLEKAKAKGNLDFFKGEQPSYAIIHSVLTGEMTDYLDYIGIPYSIFSLDTRKNNLILFNEKNFENVMEIEKGTRIRLGLEIETKEDLQMAIYENNKLTGKLDKLSCIKGLSEYEAKRICELMNEAHLVCVYKMYPDFTYEISTHKKNSKEIQRYLIQTMVEESLDKEKVEKKLFFYGQDKKIAEIFAKLDEYDLRDDAYFYSGLNPETYIKVADDKFYYVENGKQRFSQPMTETFTERLNLAMHLIDLPVAAYGFEADSVKTEIKSLAKDDLKLVTEESNEHLSEVLSLYRDSKEEDGIMVIDDDSELAKDINDKLTDISIFTEKAGVTLEYMMESDYGYDLEATLDIANGKCINITDKVEEEKEEEIKENKEIAEKEVEKEREGEVR